MSFMSVLVYQYVSMVILPVASVLVYFKLCMLLNNGTSGLIQG